VVIRRSSESRETGLLGVQPCDRRLLRTVCGQRRRTVGYSYRHSFRRSWFSGGVLGLAGIVCRLLKFYCYGSAVGGLFHFQVTAAMNFE